MLYFYLSIQKNIDDDFIVDIDKKTRSYTQKKHLKSRKLGIINFSLLVIGFIVQRKFEFQ